MGKQRSKGNAVRAGRPVNTRECNEAEGFLDGIGEIMIDEHIIEPNNMVKNDQYRENSRTNSQNPRNRKQGSHKRERDSSGVKKTQIEILDHETPIEEYQQSY